MLVLNVDNMNVADNAAVIGRDTGADPITANETLGEQDLGFTGFGTLIGAATASDWFDLRAGASLTGSIDGRGGNDSLDYHDYTTAVRVNLGSAAYDYATNPPSHPARPPTSAAAWPPAAPAAASKTCSAATATTRSPATTTRISWATDSAAT